LIEILTMMGVGVLLGYIMGWHTMESIFLGGMLAMSSTTIIIKAFDDMKLKNEPFVDLTMVVLIIQDLVAIVMMVLLSTAAASQKFAGKEMIGCMLKLGFFLVLWFAVGIFVIPTFFRKAKKYINDETLLIISIGLCFGMVIFANKVGFSSALGAFVMGSILAETIESEHIVKLTKGLKDLFGAIFFVSVGMMVDPQILVHYWKLILSLIFITLVIKTVVSSGAVLMSGESLKVSFQTGFSLSQIGEFAFIIASLGVSLGVMRGYIYPVIIAASVITTFTTPYWIRAAVPVYHFMDKHLSPNIKQKLDNYCLIGQKSATKNWRDVIKQTLPRVLVFTVLSFAILAILFDHVFPFVKGLGIRDMMPRVLYNTICAVISLAIVSPFLYGIVSNSHKTKALYDLLAKNNKGNVIAITVWTLLRMVIAAFFVFSILVNFYKYTKWVIVLITIAIVVFIMFSRQTLKRFSFLENSFMSNLNAKDNQPESDIAEEN